MGVAVVGSTTGPPGMQRFSPPAPSPGFGPWRRRRGAVRSTAHCAALNRPAFGRWPGRRPPGAGALLPPAAVPDRSEPWSPPSPRRPARPRPGQAAAGSPAGRGGGPPPGAAAGAARGRPRPIGRAVRAPPTEVRTRRRRAFAGVYANVPAIVSVLTNANTAGRDEIRESHAGAFLFFPSTSSPFDLAGGRFFRGGRRESVIVFAGSGSTWPARPGRRRPAPIFNTGLNEKGRNVDVTA